MKKSASLFVCLILLTFNLSLISAQALNIAPMTWTSGRSDWINVQSMAGTHGITTNATGNGTTDDAPAIQQALNAASAPGSTVTTVYLPPGTYKINSTLYWSADVSSIQSWGGANGLWLVGCGSNTIIQWGGVMGTAGQPMFLDQGASRSHYEGIVWNAGTTNPAGFGVAHASIALYQTRIRHENEAFIGFVGASNMGTLSPLYAYTETSGTISTTTSITSGSTVLPLSSIPAGLVLGAGITGTGISSSANFPDGSAKTTTTVTAINTTPTPPTITISAATTAALANGAVLNFTSPVVSTTLTSSGASSLTLNTVTMNGRSGYYTTVSVGMGIAGPGILPGTTVTAVNTTTDVITISPSTTATESSGTAYNFTETVPAAGIFGGSNMEAQALGEAMIWNCLFSGDSIGAMVGYQKFNNYTWIFKSCESDNCGTGISGGGAGKFVVMDTHFSGSSTVDILAGLTTRVRRCTSSGSKQFFFQGDTGNWSMNVIEDCWVDSWTITSGAISINDRSDTVFDCMFTHPPSGELGDIYLSPSNELDLTLSNNYSSTTVPITYVAGGTVNQLNIPGGAGISGLTSPSETFLQQTWPADGTTVIDITNQLAITGSANAVRYTDCTASIQGAINYAESHATSSNPIVVYIPAGYFAIGVSTTSNTGLTASGGNYTIQGSGFGSALYWDGSATTAVPMIAVTAPQNMTIEQLQLAIASASGVSYQPCISTTSSVACSAVYDQCMSGAYSNSPGIKLTSLPAGSTVLMPCCDSALTVNNCGAAVIFCDYLLTTGVSVSGNSVSPSTGFTGVLAMEGGNNTAGNTSGWDVTINDNQDFVGCDYYVESSEGTIAGGGGHLLAENTDGVSWTGNIAFQGTKQNSLAASTTIEINNFGGSIFYGSQAFNEEMTTGPIFTSTGTAQSNLILTGDIYFYAPTFTLGSSCNLIEENDVTTYPSVTFVTNSPNTSSSYYTAPCWYWGTPSTTNANYVDGIEAAAGLDHIRQADWYDLLLNYGWSQTVTNPAFAADPPNLSPTTTLGFSPATWTLSGAMSTTSGVRNVTAVTGTNSPFGPSGQCLLVIDTTASSSGSRITFEDNSMPPTMTYGSPAVLSFDFCPNASSGTAGFIQLRAWAGTVAGCNMMLSTSTTAGTLTAVVNGVNTTLTSSLVLGTWYRAQVVLPAPSSYTGAHKTATLYLTPWNNSTHSPGATTSYAIDEFDSAPPAQGFDWITFNTNTPGQVVNDYFANITLNSTPLPASGIPFMP